MWILRMELSALSVCHCKEYERVTRVMTACLISTPGLQSAERMREICAKKESERSLQPDLGLPLDVKDII